MILVSLYVYILRSSAGVKDMPTNSTSTRRGSNMYTHNVSGEIETIYVDTAPAHCAGTEYGNKEAPAVSECSYKIV